MRALLKLLLWIAGLLAIGSVIGMSSQSHIYGWYAGLNRAPYNPPNYVFGVAWSILYTLIACCGWRIWCAPENQKIPLIKSIFVLQLLMNWLWSPLFFTFHFVATALFWLLGLVTVVVWLMTLLRQQRMMLAFWLLVPYVVWLGFATYLTTYIYLYN